MKAKRLRQNNFTRAAPSTSLRWRKVGSANCRAPNLVWISLHYCPFDARKRPTLAEFRVTKNKSSQTPSHRNSVESQCFGPAGAQPLAPSPDLKLAAAEYLTV